MEPTNEKLKDRYAGLSTEELLSIYSDSELTQTARPLLQAELKRRGVDVGDIDAKRQMAVDQDLTEASIKTQRPTSITVICVLGFIGAALTIPMIFSPIAQQIGSWYPPYLAFAAVVGLACMVGLWMMKKWAAYGYTGFVVLNQFVLLAMGVWNIFALVIPAIVIFFALKHVSKMT